MGKDTGRLSCTAKALLETESEGLSGILQSGEGSVCWGDTALSTHATAHQNAWAELTALPCNQTPNYGWRP